MTKLTIKEILKGTTPGKMQTVGIMQVIPLISEIDDDRFVSPSMEGKVGTEGYGSMMFENTSSKNMIIPNHTAYMVKQAAQNHAMTHAGILAAKSKKIYNTAACIQQSQAGYITPDMHEISILPFALREHALGLRNTSSYNKLWPAISEFNRRCGLADTGGHLEKFYDHFNKELEEFAAEFETVPNQVGAIVLIMGKVVGIDRTPSKAYWSSIWRGLIRGCYGALAIQFEKENAINANQINSVRVPLGKNVNSIADIEAELSKAELTQDEFAKSTVRELIDEEFEVVKEESVGTYERNNISNKQLIGQIIADEIGLVVYASLVTKDKWFRTDSKLTKIKQFDI